jgi:MFS family permease
VGRRPYYGWVIVAVATLAVFMSSPGQTYVAAVFVDPIHQETGWSRTLISGLYTGGSLTAAAGLFLVGRLMDRRGPRLALVVVGVSFGLTALGMSQVTHPLHLYAGFVLLRLLGQGSLNLIPTTMVAQWFVRLRGRAISVTALGAIAGQATFPPALHFLIARTDWRTAWVVQAALVWALLLPPVLLFVQRTPESMGLRPDGDPPRAATGQPVDAATEPLDEEWTPGEAFQTSTFWLLMAAGASHPLISTALTFHHVSFLASRGLDATMAAMVFTVMAPFSLVGTLIAGAVVDRFVVRHLLVAAQGGLMVALLWSATISMPWQAVVYGGLLGLTSGFGMTLQSVVWPSYFGRRHLGSIRSVAAASMVASAAIGPLPFGWLFDLTGSYNLGILVFLMLPVLSAAAAASAVPPRR